MLYRVSFSLKVIICFLNLGITFTILYCISYMNSIKVILLIMILRCYYFHTFIIIFEFNPTMYNIVVFIKYLNRIFSQELWFNRFFKINDKIFVNVYVR